MRRRNLIALQGQCDRWNKTHPVGARVLYHSVIGEGEGVAYSTRTPAEILSGHTAVVWLVGFSGCVALDALSDPVPTEEQIA